MIDIDLFDPSDKEFLKDWKSKMDKMYFGPSKQSFSKPNKDEESQMNSRGDDISYENIGKVPKYIPGGSPRQCELLEQY